MTYGEMTLRSEKHHKTQNDLKARWGFYFPRCGRPVHIYTHKRRHDLDRKNTHKRSYIIQYIHASSTMPSTRDAVRTKSHYQKTNVLYIYRNIPLKYIYVYQKVGIIRACISAIYIYINHSIYYETSSFRTRLPSVSHRYRLYLHKYIETFQCTRHVII